jgi:hypothetical protein
MARFKSTAALPAARLVPAARVVPVPAIVFQSGIFFFFTKKKKMASHSFDTSTFSTVFTDQHCKNQVADPDGIDKSSEYYVKYGDECTHLHQALTAQVVQQNVPDNTTLYSDLNCTREVEMSGADAIRSMDADKDYYGFITENGTETCKKRRKESLDTPSTPSLYTSCGSLPFGWGKTKVEEKFSMCYTLSDDRKLCYDNVSNLNDITGCRPTGTSVGGAVRFDCSEHSEHSESVDLYSDSCTTPISHALDALEPGKEYYVKSRQPGTVNIYNCLRTTKKETPLYQSCGWLPFGLSKEEADDKLYSMCIEHIGKKEKMCLNGLRNYEHFHGCYLANNSEREGEIDC